MREKPKKQYFTDEIKAETEALLKKDYSPEHIAGRMKLEGNPTVSHERIYQRVWADKKQGGELYKHLRRKGRKYRKCGFAKDIRGIIKDWIFR